MEEQLQKLTQAILARGELLKQLQLQCAAIQASVEEMKPIRPEVKTKTEPAALVDSDPLLRADVSHPSTIDRRLGPSGRRDEVTPFVDIKADSQWLISPIQDPPQSATRSAQASSSSSLATGKLDNLMPARCSMMCSGDDTASQKSALMPDAALGSPSTAALLDVAITDPAPSLGAPSVCADTCIIAVHQLFGEMPPHAEVDHAVAEVTPCTDHALVNHHPSRNLPSVDAAEGSSWNPWHDQLMHQSSGGVVVVLQPWPPPTQEHVNWFNRFDERDQHQVVMRLLEVSGRQGRSSSRQDGSRLAWSRSYAAKDIQFGVEARALMLRVVEELQYTEEACKLLVVQMQLKELSGGIDLEENNVVSFQLFLQEKSELTSQLEHLLHVCSGVLDGKARSLMEKELGNMLKVFGTQATEPLRAMVMGAPLEDARHLAQKFHDRIERQEIVSWDTIIGGNMEDVAACFQYYTGLAKALDGKQDSPISLPLENFKSYVLKEPIGVVGLNTFWNYSLLRATWKVAPALAAGCTAMLKPFELYSLTCLELGAIWEEIGLLPGVLNIITGLGPQAGAPLASHHYVDRIAFTGSTETGKRIMTAAAQMVKPVSLELGGKSPLIVFDDEAEYQGREKFVKEIDIVVADVVMAIVVDFMLVYPSVPTVSLQPPFASNAGHMATFFHKGTDNAFQMALTGGSNSLLHRLGAILSNGAKLFAVGISASMIGTGVTNALIKAMKAVDKELDDKIEDIPYVLTIVAYGIYMAVSSNLRYQVLAGVIRQRMLEPLLHNHKLLLEHLVCMVDILGMEKKLLVVSFWQFRANCSKYMLQTVPMRVRQRLMASDRGQLLHLHRLRQQKHGGDCVRVRLGVEVILVPWDPGGN